MRYALLIVFVCCSLCLSAKTKKNRQYDMREQDLVSEVISCLQSKSSSAYTKLFPESDSIAYWLLQFVDPNSDKYMKLSYQLSNPSIGMQIDSALDKRLVRNFDSIIRRGERMGVNWNAILLARYELLKMPKIRDSVFEKLAPDRFKGYFFVRDMLTRKSYGIAINNILRIGNRYYGGEIHSIYRAISIDEYNDKNRLEEQRIRKGKNGYFGEDSTVIAVTNEDEDDKNDMRRQIVDRKLFTGTFDNDIEVELYIRYIKGGCPEGICSWEGTFKFGNKEEVRAEITRTADGKWHIAEENGVMTLTLEGDTYKGTWTSATDGTEYEVLIHDTPVNNRKLRYLDDLID